MTDRPLVTQRTWSQDPSNGVSVRSQADVWSNSLVTNLSPIIYQLRPPLNAFRSWHKDPSAVPYGYTQTQAIEEVAPTLTIQSFDYPNPLSYQYPSSLRTWTNASISSPPAPPTSNYDQPNPKGYNYPSDLRTFTQNIALTNPIPSNVTNWPNPLGPLYPSSNRTWSYSGFNQLEGGVVLNPAEANYDWPVPSGYRYPSDLRTFTQNTSQSLKGITGTPVTSFNWPNPTLRSWTPANETYANALQILGLQAPLTNDDFPNPVLRIYPSEKLSFNNRSDLLYGFLNPPINQTEWPNPRGYTYPQDLRFWTQGIIAAEDTPPSNQYTWPNPVRSTTALNQLSYSLNTSPLLKALVQTPPKTNYDRPNPLRYPSGITIKVGESYGSPLTLTTFTPSITTGQHNRYFFANMGSMWSNP